MSKAKIYDPLFAERMKFIAEKVFSNNNSEFARAVGVAVTSLNRWLIGEADPSRSNLIRIAEVANVSLEWLAMGIGSSDNTEKMQDTELTSDDGFATIDDCRDIAISAGYGRENGDYSEQQHTKIEKAWLDARWLNAKDCALFRVSGDSMFPTLKDGEEIIVDRSKQELKDGKIFVINRQGEMLVKKVQLTLNGVKLLSDNSFYEPIELDETDAEHLRIVGQVVRGYKNF
ncbi:helix-turn-helix transcriptional regulator [Pasteurellaceae bacterium HPA106]|uniref:LexA family transcriptional regulator n=1 Tax=Spirabiliibacterium pneumoniae TaxID=221400 RepID=UPI001AAD2E0F|nr:S24 family peptidase [Spirabiliibacterium pneumoniae]MBE2895489.1 helix-turn-helix transcriptional regulator [Spirabiliibacterium pneumoniae]